MNALEYDKMFRVEGQLWWYRSLHERVAAELARQYGARRDVAVLDVGCGTGGLLSHLSNLGYTNLRGLDGSAEAVAFCQTRGLTVSQQDLNHLPDSPQTGPYDVLVCNDIFCYFNDAQLTALLQKLARWLKPDGLLISNNNAFRVFWGQHDLAVGSIRRFVRADFERLLSTAGLQLLRSTYWSFALSPVILLARQWQRLQLNFGWRSPETARSDVALPPNWLNNLLYGVVKIERKLLPRTPFGSSLFIVGELVSR